MQVVVIGAGPRALFALEALSRHRGSRHLDVTVVDPAAHPGTGSAYAPDQPAMLRLNVTSSILDQSATGMPDFPTWARTHDPGSAATPYPPRAAVGRYLAERWQRAMEAFPGRVRHLRARARDVVPLAGGTWEVLTEGGPPLPAHEVLVATGHAGDHPGALRHTWPATSAIRLVPGVLPVERLLTERTVPAGSRVAIRGAALTFCDAALALTLGRGASFTPDPDDRYGLIHHRGAAEPAVMLPLARHGLLLAAKPEPGTPLPAGGDQVLARGRAELDALAGGSADAIPAHIEATITRTAAALLETAHQEQPDTPPSPGLGPAAAALERSIHAAHGQDRDLPWALGRTWSALYPQVTALMRGSCASSDAFAHFGRTAATLERLAFGPPLETASRLLAMIRSGAVDTTWLDAGVPADPLLLAQGAEGQAAPEVMIDAVLAPPGIVSVTDPLLAALQERGLLAVRPGRRGAMVAEDATALAADGRPHEHLAVVGRACEDHVIGHDTLNRHLQPDIDTWAARVTDRSTMTHRPTGLRDRCRGEVPLPGHLAPWMQELLGDPDACDHLLTKHGSPVNVHDFTALAAHAAELTDAAAEQGVSLRIFAARKANKTLALVDAARAAGLGLDVGSEREMLQALERGTAPADVVLTAAVKPESLIRAAVSAGVLIVLDNLEEADSVAATARELGRTAPVAVRLAPVPGANMAPTRFGEASTAWVRWASELSAAGVDAPLTLTGVHFHLHGYAAATRAAALSEAVDLVDALRAHGHRIGFIDIGGGIPMSYLDSGADWEAFWAQLGRALRGERPPLTWRGDGLGLRPADAGAAAEPPGPAPSSALTGLERARRAAGPGLRGMPTLYPYHQSPVRGAWLTELLNTPLAEGASAAEALVSRGLELRCEPGRSLLDGCGLTLARVVHRTRTSDGIDLVALAMNRTQCRSTSADFLVDPVLVRPATAGEPSAPMRGYLVGAYCIEEELLTRRLLEFPCGVARGDVIAFPNTAGYLMHILESASHQIPLAANVSATDTGFVRDDIDALSTAPTVTP